MMLKPWLPYFDITSTNSCDGRDRSRDERVSSMKRGRASKDGASA